jgi:hypothetical protein
MSFDPTKFYLGVNIGDLHDKHGHDLSIGFLHSKTGWSREPLLDTTSGTDIGFNNIIEAYFKHLKIRQIKVVRIWLLERLEGMTFSGGKFSFRNWTDFRTRIDHIMKTAHANGIQIYWCLFDAAELLSSNTPDSSLRSYWTTLWKNDLVNGVNSNDIKARIEQFLDCLLSSYPDSVFAIDIVNEVDWTWSQSVGMMLPAPRGRQAQPTVIPFVKAIYDLIPRNFRCTASFAHYSEFTKYQQQFNFLDFYDYHRYFMPNKPDDTDNGDLPTWKDPDDTGKACIIGEIGHNYAGKKGEKPFDENKQASSSETIMQQALKEKYSGALLWKYTPVDTRKQRLLRLTRTDTGDPSTGTLAQFLNNFTNAASTPSPGVPNPFSDYERLVWNNVSSFASKIPLDRIP